MAWHFRPRGRGNRAPQGLGGWRARFWQLLRGMVALSASRPRKSWERRTLEAAGWRARFGYRQLGNPGRGVLYTWLAWALLVPRLSRGMVGTFGSKSVAEAYSRKVWRLACPLGYSRMEWSALSVLRPRKPWQGRTLDRSGGWRARFWLPRLLRGRRILGRSGGYITPPLAWNGRHFQATGRGVLQSCLVVGVLAVGYLRCGVGWSALLASTARKPWQGRTLDRSGGWRARFRLPRLLRGRVGTFGLEASETVARAYSTQVWWLACLLLVTRGMVVALSASRPEALEIVAGTYSRRIWWLARASGSPGSCVEWSALSASTAR